MLFRSLRRAMVRAAKHIIARDQEQPPGMTAAEFDRLRWQRDIAAERLLEAALQTGETIWMLSARIAMAQGAVQKTSVPSEDVKRDPSKKISKPAVGKLLAAVFMDDQQMIRQQMECIRYHLRGKTVLYVPLSRGGRPDRVFEIGRASCRERV